MTKLGFIGVGNMGGAILRGVIDGRVVEVEDVYIYDSNIKVVKAIQQEFGVLTAQSGSAMVTACDMVILAVKPNVCVAVLKECGETLIDKALVSVVAGWNRSDLAQILPQTRILRVMPNTPCMVGEGMVVFDMDHNLNAEELKFAQALFKSTGIVEQAPTYQMDGVTGISGSGPAYVYLFIEALADGGVRAGVPRELAYKLAAQTVLGSAKMVLETGEHPGKLKDSVCSPGGTTIEAISALEHAGFRAAVLDAVDACVNRIHQINDKK
ncbi:MAG: pyrroline-5-carboxylate reductase [Clostridiales bacterium]|jgi:pyrroline-5-carboxylate reductase|nr:pyrroline-5-carboxylate reductase [Clostridiales bacterium]